jgi:hypothetical protein
VADPLANLNGFSDKTLDDCYGAVETAGDAGKQLHGSNVVHQNIIKRFNQAGALLLFKETLIFLDRHPSQDQPFHKEMAIQTDVAFCFMPGA